MPVEPILIIDSKERWLPVPVEDSLALYGYTWEGTSWQRDGKPVDRIDFPSGMVPDDFSELPVVGYHRVRAAGKVYWHQFWTWWPYNPKNYPPTKRGVGEHEGDWEMIQLGCKDEAGEEPVLASYSQHGGGERKHYWDVELSDGKKGQPLVYVGRDSHANYFNTVRNVTDSADGNGKRLDPEWREFKPWAQWKGQWGNSANSPGALSTRRVWSAPHAWHSQARG